MLFVLIILESKLSCISISIILFSYYYISVAIYYNRVIISILLYIWVIIYYTSILSLLIIYLVTVKYRNSMYENITTLFIVKQPKRLTF